MGLGGSYRTISRWIFSCDLQHEGQESNPYWLVVAGYGSGKSHLAVTCASLLAEPGGSLSKRIVEQIRKADTDIAEEAANLLTHLSKPSLVIPLDGMSGFHLGSALSRSVFAQLRIHGVDAAAVRALSPRFQTAEQFVRRNFEIRQESFQNELPNTSLDQICDRLAQQDETMYSLVDRIYSESNGQPIPVEGQESAQDLIDTLCNVYCAESGPFSSVVVLFDEFGRYLEYAAERPHLAGDAALQQIFQGIQDNAAKARFIGFIQYELKAYLKRFGGADLRQLQRYITRFDSADKFYLSSNAETLFANIIGNNEKTLDAEWEAGQGDHLSFLAWQRMSKTLPSFERFPTWANSDQFARVIARGCWPLHPLAVWLLTRQRDVVQSRSALTFVRDTITRVSQEPATSDGQLRRVRAAELIKDQMISELIAAERQVGGSSAETLQNLLEKFSGHLSKDQELALTSITALEKMRLGKQQQNLVDDMLEEATGLDRVKLGETLQSLFELGAAEWNRDLGKYELISDGTSRAQFQSWLRAPLAKLTSDAIRELFIRRAGTDSQLGDITTDFGLKNDISTSEWFFEKSFAHAGNIENAIDRSFKDWSVADSPKEAKGKVIYLYLHPKDEPEVAHNIVRECFEQNLKKTGQARAPIWVIGLVDAKGQLAENMARLHILQDNLSVQDTERYGRFIPEEIERTSRAFRELVQEAVKERCYWVAGFDAGFEGRLSAAGNTIFSAVYPETIPFPFDGFATAAGGGAADAAQLTRALISRLVSVSWMQAQSRRLQNRVDSVLMKAWKAFLPSGKLSSPRHPGVKKLFDGLVSLHKEDPSRTILDSYQFLLRPPYGLNSSSAALLLGLLLRDESNPCRVEQGKKLVSASDWINRVYPNSRSNFFDHEILEDSRLRFIAEDTGERWRALLSKWENEQNYLAKVSLNREAEKLMSVESIPEVLEGQYKYLRDVTEPISQKLLETERRIKAWEKEFERAEKEDDGSVIVHVGGQVASLQKEMVTSGLWSETYIKLCEPLIALAKEYLNAKIQSWIVKQVCRNVAQLGEFKTRNDLATADLEALGFVEAAKALQQQVQSSIQRVEQLQKYSLTLANADDYPRQPVPSSSTPLAEIRDDISNGNQLVTALQEAKQTLTAQEIKVRVSAIKNRQSYSQIWCMRTIRQRLPGYSSVGLFGRLLAHS